MGREGGRGRAAAVVGFGRRGLLRCDDGKAGSGFAHPSIFVWREVDRKDVSDVGIDHAGMFICCSEGTSGNLPFQVVGGMEATATMTTRSFIHASPRANDEQIPNGEIQNSGD